VGHAKANAVRYLSQAQRPDGAWFPLWFGNQHAPDETNATYGTSKVLMALSALNPREFPEFVSLLERGAHWLLTAQSEAGAWSGTADGPASIEETALAVEALVAVVTSGAAASVEMPGCNAVLRATIWLIEQVENGAWRNPSPIGFYFAKLWYFERLYPMIFTVGALGRVTKTFAGHLPVTS
jgi:squalene-hopene/tetraprenyl-beta-curcumene cyclase